MKPKTKRNQFSPRPKTTFFYACLICAFVSNLSFAVAADDSRLISTDASVTELLFALDMDDELVAVDVTSQLPDNYRSLANVGYHRQLSAEGLLSLNPSAVIGSSHMGPPPVLNALEKAQIKLVQLDSPTNPLQLQNNIALLGNALEKQARAERLLLSLDQKLTELQSMSLKGKAVAFLLTTDSTKLRLAGGGTGAAALIDIMGGTNTGNFDGYRNVSAESLLALQPDVILVASHGTADLISSLLNVNPVLEHTPAAKSQNIFTIDGRALVAGLSIGAVDEALRLNRQIQQ